jgi:actin-related protein
MDKLEQIMESWTQKIAQTIKKEEAKKAEPNSSIAEIEYWRARNAVISTLYQYFIIYGFWDEKYTLYTLILLRYILFLTN